MLHWVSGYLECQLCRLTLGHDIWAACLYFYYIALESINTDLGQVSAVDRVQIAAPYSGLARVSSSPVV